ncbi:hypothetical protein RISK_001125 [Rhodopirellula islandica]|uniref:Uncharacterized protein n=1 Tax=Rhodopirellula islandica TaxID=595434 RepID=A0A0J1BJS9_RHOIS|nr:hypothetical protein RISK_001125 [Rhodopirellula islandica]
MFTQCVRDFLENETWARHLVWILARKDSRTVLRLSQTLEILRL